MNSKTSKIELLRYDKALGCTAFSTKRGEAVQPSLPYSGFNITHYCGDIPAHVQACREMLCATLGIADGQLILPRQVHGTAVRLIDQNFLSLSAQEQAAQLDGVDALLTSQPCLCIGVSTADCLPLLLYDPRTQSAAAVHAGWRGLAAHIITRTMRQMERTFAAAPHDIRAVIGPHIRVADFEVGEEVVENFLAAGFPADIVARREGEKPHIHLAHAATWELLSLGLRPASIHDAQVSTYQHPDVYPSARRLGISSARMFTGIMLG